MATEMCRTWLADIPVASRKAGLVTSTLQAKVSIQLQQQFKVILNKVQYQTIKSHKLEQNVNIESAMSHRRFQSRPRNTIVPWITGSLAEMQ